MAALLYLLPLGLIFDLCGYMPPSLRLALTYILLALPLCVWPSRHAGGAAVWLGVLAVVGAWLPMSPLAEMFWLLLAHQVVWWRVARVGTPLRAGTAVYAVAHAFFFAAPGGHAVTELLATGGDAVARLLTGGEFHLGPTHHGIGGLLLFMLLGLFLVDGTRVGWLRPLVLLPLLILAGTLAAVLMLEKAKLVGVDGISSEFAWTLKFRDDFRFPELWERLRTMAVIFQPGLLFLGQLVVFLGVCGKLGANAHEPGAPSWLHGRWLAAPAMLATLVVVFATPPTVWRPLKERELVFVERGVVSFSKPNYQHFGEYAGGMFGMVPEYAALLGHDAVVVEDIPETLNPNQILVLTNLDVDFGEDVRRRIWDFVEGGGALLLLGDHTFVKADDINHLNVMLEPTGIRFAHDSAQFFPQGWFHSYRFPQGTPFANLRDDAENRPGVLVGASLELESPAHPLVVGRFGFGDLGPDQPDERLGYLGDFVYQRHERLGDLVLLAGQRYGKGRVLVYGDTSSFFNNNLARSHEILAASLRWLGEGNGWLLPFSTAGRWLTGLAVVGLLALGFAGRGLGWTGLSVTAAAAAVAVIGQWERGLRPLDMDHARRHLAVIDFSHQPNASKHTATSAGLHGVSLNLMRHGKLPVAMNRWCPRLIDHARIVVVNAPRRPFTPRERAALTRMMERGGIVVLGCGFPDKAGSRSLLDPLGVEIGNMPLGRFFNLEAFGDRVSFMDSWVIERLPPEAEVLCSSPNEWVLMAFVPVGKGGMVVIGDSEFLHNRNLEGHRNHDPQNTTFIRNLLDTHAP